MTTLVLETEPAATNVTLTDKQLTIELFDGRSMSVKQPSEGTTEQISESKQKDADFENTPVEEPREDN